MARHKNLAVIPDMLKPESLPALQSALDEAGLDGWLIYDFHGLNPVAVGLLQLPGMTTRRFFVYVPRNGSPVAITHAIEQGPWTERPANWRKETYSSWRLI
jgi:Xaa-Pro dipeptidase